MRGFGASNHPLVISNYLYLNFSHGHEFVAISRVSIPQDNLPEVSSFYTSSNLLASTPHQALHSFSSIPRLLVWPVHCKPNPRTLHGTYPGQLQHECQFPKKCLPIHPKPTMHKKSSHGPSNCHHFPGFHTPRLANRNLLFCTHSNLLRSTSPVFFNSWAIGVASTL